LNPQLALVLLQQRNPLLDSADLSAVNHESNDTAALPVRTARTVLLHRCSSAGRRCAFRVAPPAVAARQERSIQTGEPQGPFSYRRRNSEEQLLRAFLNGQRRRGSVRGVGTDHELKDAGLDSA
jgi:hypothetical protein